MIKKKRKNLIIAGFLLIILIVVFGIYQIQKISPDTSSTKTTKDAQIEYRNNEYNFTFSLPQSWKGYSILAMNWEGFMIDTQAGQKIVGPMILIRHPLWTSENPRQDIPIMVFTYSQWDLIQQEKLSVSAAPIGPSELGRNSKYVFALPARYNFTFQTGFEEIVNILEGKPFRAF